MNEKTCVDQWMWHQWQRYPYGKGEDEEDDKHQERKRQRAVTYVPLVKCTPSLSLNTV